MGFPTRDSPFDDPLYESLQQAKGGSGKTCRELSPDYKKDESRARHDTAMLQLRLLCLKQWPSHGLLEVTWDKGLAAIRIRHDMRLPPFPATEGKELPPLQLMSFSPVNEGR